MIKKQNYQNNNPTLYLIPTPIGNLEDITLRTLNILRTVDKIYAEDTRVTIKLLSHYDIRKPLDSLHEHNESVKITNVLNDLKNGLNVGLVSDAGMPLISDPGFDLVGRIMSEGYNVVSLPGANALLPALAMSGIKTHPFLFFGFLDSKSNKRIAELKELKHLQVTLVFYEAIHRITDTLKDMFEIFGPREFSIVREISKAFEEVIKGTLDEYLDVGELKGELVIVVSGNIETSEKMELSLVEQVDYFIGAGYKKTEAMKMVSEMTGTPKNKIYEEYLNEKIKKG